MILNVVLFVSVFLTAMPFELAHAGPTSAQKIDWDYDGSILGPDKWHTRYASCKGSEQSPIILNPDGPETQVDTSMSSVVYSQAYLASIKGNLSFLPWSVKLTPDDPTGFTITGGPLGSEIYQLSYIHPHWGCVDGEGSEHVMNFKRYSMETHLVHWNTKYGDSNNAMNYRDGLAVIAIFHEKFPTKSSAYKILSPKSPKGSASGSLTIDTYYTYLGSLTTPGCNETVRWIVSSKVEAINLTVLQNLRTMINSSGTPVCGNFRPLQSIGNRTVIKNF